MDLLWYGFPWHAQQLYRECRRQCHIAFSAHSITEACQQELYVALDSEIIREASMTLA